MKPDSPQSCTTCKWGRFEMTNHKPPRINPTRSGKCLYPEERIALPFSITKAYGFSLYRCAVWPHLAGCPTWEPKA